MTIIDDDGIMHKVLPIDTLDKIRAEIEPKCDRINSLASVLPYTTHREIQELLCEIMDLCKTEGETHERSVNEENATWLIGKMKSDINGIRYSHMFDYVSRERILDTVIEIIDKYTKGESL